MAQFPGALALGLLLLGLGSAAEPVRAQSANWTGAVSADWYDPGNWTTAEGGTAPPDGLTRVEITLPAGANVVPVHQAPGPVPEGEVVTTDIFALSLFSVGSRAADLVVRGLGNRLAVFSNLSVGGWTGATRAQLTLEEGAILNVGTQPYLGIRGVSVNGEGFWGKLLIRSGATLTSYNLSIANSFADSAEVEVTGPGTVLAAGLTEVGNGGQGRLLMRDGAEAHLEALRIGRFASAKGRAEVAGAELTVFDRITLGDLGIGVLDLSDGSQVRADQLLLGSGRQGANAGLGFLIIRDGASLTLGQGAWDAAEPRGIIGGPGQGTVTVQSGGVLEAGDSTRRGILRVGSGFGLAGQRAETPEDPRSGPSGRLVIGSLSGPVAPGQVEAAQVELGDAGELIFAHDDGGYSFAPDLTGSGVIEVRSGRSALTGDSSGFAGSAHVSGGALAVEGVLGDAGGGRLRVGRGAALAGSGEIRMVTDLDDGAVLELEQGQTLTLSELILSENSVLSARLDAPGAEAPLAAVRGALVLDGRLDVTALPDFGNGVYTLLTYGSLTEDRGLELGALPEDLSYELASSTPVEGKLTLTVGGGSAGANSYWDGAGLTPGGIRHGRGGSGTWEALSPNWTNSAGSQNGPWEPGFAVFSGTGGRVTLLGAQQASGLQFAADGYVLAAGEAGALELTGASSVLRVDAGKTVRFDVPLSSAGTLDLRDSGTAVFAGPLEVAGDLALKTGSHAVFAAGAEAQVAKDLRLEAAELKVEGAGAALEVSGELQASGASVLLLRDGGSLRSGAIRFGTAGSAARLEIGSSAEGESPAAARLEAPALELLAGSLHLDRSGRAVIGDLRIGAAGLMTGTGQLEGDLHIAGRLAPRPAAVGAGLGDAPALRVSGAVEFAPGAVYEVLARSGGAASGLEAGGAAKLAGSVEVVTPDAESAYQAGQSYSILRAQSVEGTFDRVTRLSESAFLRPSLSYTGSEVRLTLDVTRDLETAALSYNQSEASRGLDSLDRSPGSDALAMFTAVADLSEAGAQRAFDLVSGEVHAALKPMVDDSAARFGRLLRLQGLGALAPEGAASRAVWSLASSGSLAAEGPGAGAEVSRSAGFGLGSGAGHLWLTPSASTGSVKGDGNAAASDWRSSGLALGYTLDLGGAAGESVVGLAFGWQQGRLDLDGRRSSADSRSWQVGLYGAHHSGPWSLAGALSWGRSTVETRRSLDFAGRIARADYEVETLGLGLEASYAFDIAPQTKIAPLMTLEASWSRHDGFAETGAGALGLRGAADSWRSLTAGLGLAMTHEVATSGGRLRLDGRLVLEQNWGDQLPQQALQLAGGSAGFVVRGAAQDDQSLRLSTGLAWDLGKEMTLRARYEGLFSESQTRHGGAIGLQMRF